MFGHRYSDLHPIRTHINHTLPLHTVRRRGRTDEELLIMFKGSKFRKDFFRSAFKSKSSTAAKLVLSLPSGLRWLGSAVLAVIYFKPSMLKMDTEHFKSVG